MRKILLSVITALILATPSTFADEAGKMVQVDVQFDLGLLNSDAGIATLMDIVETEARQACTRERVYPYGTTLDEACLEEILTKAAAQIEGKFATVDRQAPAIVLSSLEVE